MFHSKRFFALLTLLIFISLVSIGSPVHAAPAAGFPLQPVDTDKIDAYIQSQMQNASIPGLALGIVKDGQIVYLKGYGIADPNGRAVTPQTPFILGSTSKSFTALAIMQLVEAGKVDLDAPVTQYLPWFRTSDAAASAQITVRNLLNHTSGLPTYDGRLGMWDNNQSDMALENGIRRLSSVNLNHPTGGAYEYANENYDSLGLIVQTVSGISYEDYIRSSIFAPLQMHHSAAALSDPAVVDIATGYRYWFHWPVAFDAPYSRSMTPSGFLISSAEDMAHYLVTQLNGGRYDNTQILSPQGIDTLHAPGSKISASKSYGMGWEIQGQPGSIKIWHNGDLSNFHSNMMLLPDQHIGIVILINIQELYNNAAINMPIEGVAGILLGKDLGAHSNTQLSLMPQMMMLALLLIPILWFIWSYGSINRWQNQDELPPRGSSRFRRLYLPLVIDFCPLVLVWIILPSQFEAPMEIVALSVPDVFAVIVILTLLSMGWIMARIYLTFRSLSLTKHASSGVQTMIQLITTKES